MAEDDSVLRQTDGWRVWAVVDRAAKVVVWGALARAPCRAGALVGVAAGMRPLRASSA